MTLIKSLLLGSAAGIVAVASAQAADLPTKKAAPVEYVKVCNVGGITGWTLPGSDTCVKFSGYMTAQVEGGNLNTQYNYGSIRGRGYGRRDACPIPECALSRPVWHVTSTLARPRHCGDSIIPRLTQRVLIAASPAQNNTTFNRNEFG